MRAHKRLVAGVLAVVVASGTGCSSSPSLSNGSVSACFRAIPAGRAAIHDGQAQLVGVHRVSLDQVRSHLPEQVQKTLTAEDDTAVCAMAFEGNFSPGQVDLSPPGESGPYALVLVSSRKLHLLASFVLPHLPHSFGGRIL